MPTFVITPVGDTYSMVSDSYHDSLVEKNFASDGAGDGFGAVSDFLLNTKSFCVYEYDWYANRVWWGAYTAEYHINDLNKFHKTYTNLKATYEDYDLEDSERIKIRGTGSGQVIQSGIQNPLKYRLDTSKSHHPKAPTTLTGKYLGDFYHHKGNWYAAYSDCMYRFDYIGGNFVELNNPFLTNREYSDRTKSSVISAGGENPVNLEKHIEITELFYNSSESDGDIISDCQSFNYCESSGPPSLGPLVFEITREEYDDFVARKKTVNTTINLSVDSTERIYFSAGSCSYAASVTRSLQWEKIDNTIPAFSNFCSFVYSTGVFGLKQNVNYAWGLIDGDATCGTLGNFSGKDFNPCDFAFQLSVSLSKVNDSYYIAVDCSGFFDYIYGGFLIRTSQDPTPSGYRQAGGYSGASYNGNSIELIAYEADGDEDSISYSVSFSVDITTVSL